MCENSQSRSIRFHGRGTKPMRPERFMAFWGLKIHARVLKAHRPIRCQVPQRIVREFSLPTDVVEVHPDGCIWLFSGEIWVRWYSLPDAQFVL